MIEFQEIQRKNWSLTNELKTVFVFFGIFFSKKFKKGY